MGKGVFTNSSAGMVSAQVKQKFAAQGNAKSAKEAAPKPAANVHQYTNSAGIVTDKYKYICPRFGRRVSEQAPYCV